MLIFFVILGLSEGKLPPTYYKSYVRGKLKKTFAANNYGCSVGWYTDQKKWGYPYCPGKTIELHSRFKKLNAKARDNAGPRNHVSCMACSGDGSSKNEIFFGKTFKMVCHGDGFASDLKEWFSAALYGSNTFTFNPDGTFMFPSGAGESGLYQRWTAGSGGNMTWTTHHDTVCSGTCDLRYTLVDTAPAFGSTNVGAVWFKIVNYFEIGEAACDIELVGPTRRLSHDILI